MARRAIRPLPNPADADHATVTARGKETRRGGEPPGVILRYPDCFSERDTTGAPVLESGHDLFWHASARTLMAVLLRGVAPGRRQLAHQWAAVRIAVRQSSVR